MKDRRSAFRHAVSWIGGMYLIAAITVGGAYVFDHAPRLTAVVVGVVALLVAIAIVTGIAAPRGPGPASYGERRSAHPAHRKASKETEAFDFIVSELGRGIGRTERPA